MADYNLPAPSTLGDVYSMNPGAFSQAQDFMGIAQQGAQTSNDQALANLDRYQQMTPLETQGKSLANQTLGAQLPGVVGNSTLISNHAARDTATQDSQINNLIATNGAAASKAHADDAANAGTIMAQAAQLIRSNPVGGVPLAKEMLTKAGHADMWNPDWEAGPMTALRSSDSPYDSGVGGGIDPGQVANEMEETGNNLMMTSAKVQQALTLGAQKTASAERIAQTKKESADYASDQRLNAARLAAQSRVTAAQTPKSEQMYAAQMSQLADAEDDPQRKAMYRQEADQAIAHAYQLAQAPAATNVAPKVDISKLTGGAVPTMVGSQPPSPLVGGASSMAPPGAPNASAPPGAPMAPTAPPQGAGKPMAAGSPEAQAWLARAAAANPGMSPSELMMNAYKLGKIQ